MFPREREHVLTLQLDERFAACVEEGLRLRSRLMHDVIGLLDVT